VKTSHLEYWMAFDCEAVAIPEASEYLEPVTAPSNYKDQDKIRAYVEDGTKRAIERAALDVDLARVVAIGYQSSEMIAPIVRLAANDDQERAAIAGFWSEIKFTEMPLVGFCIRTYDLPLLIRRSQLLGVPYPQISLDRYRSTDIVDLYDRLTFNGTIDGKKLTTYCRRFGVEVADEVTGAEIGALVANEDWPLVTLHVDADVKRVVALGRAIRALAPVSEHAAAF
jgi:predicted PolB exonuclease-like 3'-5' exonuclease